MDYGLDRVLRDKIFSVVLPRDSIYHSYRQVADIDLSSLILSAMLAAVRSHHVQVEARVLYCHTRVEVAAFCD